MNSKEFEEGANRMAKYIVSYLTNIRERRVLPDVQPGYMKRLLPTSPPDHPESFDDVMNEIEDVIMSGVTHWQSPRFNAYFPTGNSYPSMLADMLCSAISCIGFSWISSPACTELEIHMMDWLGELIGLPESFLARGQTGGGGVIQGSASEATLVASLSAKRKVGSSKFSARASLDQVVAQILVAYASEQSHSSVERAAMLGGVKIRLLPPDENGALRGGVLRNAVKEDLSAGFTPFFVVATTGTTNSCAFDNVREIAEVAKEFGMWTHVDAAYAGSSFVCEEFRGPMDGVELVDSFNFNPHKWLLVNFDCSAMWVRNSSDVVQAFNVDPLYLQHEHQDVVPDYRHWQIPLGRRFRSLKLWFVMKIYGKSGLQAHIREQVHLAKEFEEFVRKDPAFEIVGEVTLGLVCFRLKGSNEMNENLLRAVNNEGVIHITPGKIKDNYFLRFAVCSEQTNSADVLVSWKEIKKHSSCIGRE